jgi:hypothetical protein
MAAPPKAKPPPVSPAAKRDRTSAVVAGTLIFLTALGVVTVFWEPLAALAVGSPASESMSEARGLAGDGGAGPPAAFTNSADASGGS